MFSSFFFSFYNRNAWFQNIKESVPYTGPWPTHTCWPVLTWKSSSWKCWRDTVVGRQGLCSLPFQRLLMWPPRLGLRGPYRGKPLIMFQRPLHWNQGRAAHLLLSETAVLTVGFIIPHPLNLPRERRAESVHLGFLWGWPWSICPGKELLMEALCLPACSWHSSLFQSSLLSSSINTVSSNKWQISGTHNCFAIYRAFAM